ncbi:MAG: nuclear transport factor 2 family protein [Planctomycetota bacterium]
MEDAATPEVLMAAYERASRGHDLETVLACIDDDAVYWFSTGACHVGKPAVAEAIGRNFAAIEAEDYRLEELVWRVRTAESAVCTYRYVWAGVIGGQPASGAGRGTSVLVEKGGRWWVVHEHLSAGPAS